MIASTIFAHIVVFIGLLILCFVSFYYVRYTYLRNKPNSHSKPVITAYTSEQLDDLLTSTAHFPSEKNTPLSTKPSRFKPYMAVAFIPFAITLTAIPTVYQNRHLFLPKIQLSQKEIQQLPNIRHQLRSISNQRNKPRVTQNFSRSIVIVGQGPFLEAWHSFLADKSEIISCNSSLALTCDIRKTRKIYIIDMRGREWEQIILLLKEGHNVIAYGADENFNSRIASLIGLRSSNSESSKSSYISLVNDKELTLDITRTPPIFVGPSASSFTINSDNPQAISMLPDGLPGGFSVPRLHAKSYENGRFIWMDFLPNINPLNNKNNADVYQQLIANIIRYSDDKQYTSIATWPNGKKSAAFLASEASNHSNDLKNFLVKAKQHQIPLTSFVSSKFVFENRDSSTALARLGELGCTANQQDVFSRYSMLDQTKKLSHCKKVIQNITQQTIHGVKPPRDSFNQNTLNSILNNRLNYIFATQTIESSLPQISESHTGDMLVRIPRLSSDGFLLWNNLELDNDTALKRLIDEFDWTKSSGGLFGFTFNIEQLSKPERTDVVISLSKVIAQSDTYFSTLNDISQWWLLRQSLIGKSKDLNLKQHLIKKFKPYVLSVNANGQLIQKPFQL